MYFIYRLRWSQTDNKTVIVRAKDVQSAEEFAQKRWGGDKWKTGGPRYIERLKSPAKLVIAR